MEGVATGVANDTPLPVPPELDAKSPTTVTADMLRVEVTDGQPHASVVRSTSRHPRRAAPFMRFSATAPTVTVGNVSTSSVASSRASSHANAGTAATTKRYTHNPYASEPSTPTLSANSSINISNDHLSGSFQQTPTAYSPVYAAEGSYQESNNNNNSMYPSMGNITEQFYSMIGSIAHSSCSARGRHLLISVLRLQHLDKIQMIFDEILPQVNTLILDAQGCHVIRTLLEYLNDEQLTTLTSYLEEATIISTATSSQHTRRALQTLFERHRSSALDYIVQVVAADATRLAMTQQGCIAVMRMIENSLPHQKQHLVSALIPSLPTLTMDPYGNYVVQCILQNFDAHLTASVVCDAYTGHWVPLSCNKFASNVMEKVVRMMTGPARTTLVRELVFDTNNLLCLMQDGFGNFVLQAIIDSSTDPAEFRTIADAVRPQLHTSPYGHKIDGKLKSKRMQRSSSTASSSSSTSAN
ncbi:pumilio/PUF RNA binding protein 5, putative [Bodo saltans]|uniref:Pumilio/PUF RNA binding protein 5, putative n=1 Tax=Bodo saltans TaxID=75058 RepID=A0A0S4J2F9_BODSA|nr:pumilio/PUF RNA binding protein 5, putative [Bodo saltans]|eukprot:CUG55300.1 pumilio/PUF RNA binding protein 5, putative [Bodo saltans]